MAHDWKYEHEKHNRRDKAHKVDYREDLELETIDRSSPEHIERFRRELEFKRRLIARFRAGLFYREPYCMCLDWTFERFAERNTLGLRAFT